MLSIGIVGLPNVGKSTLFTTLTKKQVDCANFPFCTIEPNVGIVEVPDERLHKLADLQKSEKTIPAAIEFVDIAGLVRGAHKGEGLGNKFLANIREVDAICQVVRAFENTNVTHVEGTVDPMRDVETIELELIMADLSTVQTRQERLKSKMKSGKTKELEGEDRLLNRLIETFDAGKLANTLEFSDAEMIVMREMHLLTNKKIVYIVNVSEEDAADPNWVSPLPSSHLSIPVSIKIESELVELADAERTEMMGALGMEQTGLDRLIRACYDALDLITFFTAGPKEARAWSIRRGLTAPQAAGKIHGDFEKGFIRAEVTPYDVYVELGEVGAREAGKQRIEGKDYIMHDGDVVFFRVAT